MDRRKKLTRAESTRWYSGNKSQIHSNWKVSAQFRCISRYRIHGTNIGKLLLLLLCQSIRCLPQTPMKWRWWTTKGEQAAPDKKRLFCNEVVPESLETISSLNLCFCGPPNSKFAIPWATASRVSAAAHMVSGKIYAPPGGK